MPLLLPGEKNTIKYVDKSGLQGLNGPSEVSKYVPVYLPGSEIMNFSSKHGYANGSGTNIYTEFTSSYMKVGVNPVSPHNTAAVSIRTQKICVDHIDYIYVYINSLYAPGSDFSIKRIRFTSDSDGISGRYNGPDLKSGLVEIDTRAWTGNGYLHIGAKKSDNDYLFWISVNRVWVVFDDSIKEVF